jgi:hypothetical protein
MGTGPDAEGLLAAVLASDLPVRQPHVSSIVHSQITTSCAF